MTSTETSVRLFSSVVQTTNVSFLNGLSMEWRIKF